MKNEEWGEENTSGQAASGTGRRSSIPHFSFLLLATLAVAGCTQPMTPAGTSPATVTLPIQWITISQSESQPLIKLRPSGTTIDLAFKLKTPLADHLFYFGEMENNDQQMMPFVAIKENGRMQALRLEKEWGSDRWTMVCAGPNAGEVWGVLDQPKDDPGDTFSLVHSADGGKSWQVGSIHKPCDAAGFVDLVMAKNGKGRFTLMLDADCPSNAKLKAGLYHYRTTDGGKTWAAPEYEPDATRPAEEVPEEEQINQGQTAAALRGMGGSLRSRSESEAYFNGLIKNASLLPVR